MTKPTITPDWAESAVPGDVAYPTSKQAAGYQSTDTIEHDEYNALFQTQGRWINYLNAGNGGLISGLSAATTPTDGDLFVVAPENPDLYPTEEVETIAGTFDIVLIATNGTHVAYITDNTGTYQLVVRSEAVGSAVSLYTLGATPLDMAMNEDGIFVSYGTGVQYFGFNAIPKDFQAAVGITSAIVAATDRVYVSDTNELYELQYDGSGFTSAPSIYDHGAGITALCTDGRRVFVSANTNGSSETLVAVEASSGSVLWSLTSAAVPVVAGPNRIACDGRFVYVAKEADNIYKRRCSTGAESGTLSVPGTTLSCIAVTDEDIWVCVNLGMYVARKDLDLLRFSKSTTLTGYADSPDVIASSGTKLFCGGPANSGNMGTVLQLHSSPKRFQYRKGVNVYSPNGLNWCSTDLDKGY
jgi:hypothetical protein